MQIPAKKANFLQCEVGDLPRMKIGTLINTLFLLHGDTHELGGYFASMDGTLKILAINTAPSAWPLQAFRS